MTVDTTRGIKAIAWHGFC